MIIVEDCTKYIITVSVTEPHLRYILAAIESGNLDANRCKQRGNALLVSLDAPPVSPWLHHMGVAQSNFTKCGQQYRYIIIQHNHIASTYKLHEFVPHRYASPPQLDYAAIIKKYQWTLDLGATPPITPASTTPSTVDRSWTPDYTTSEHQSDVELEDPPHCMDNVVDDGDHIDPNDDSETD